jgi:hypothetical protein
MIRHSLVRCSRRQLAETAIPTPIIAVAAIHW